MTLTYPMLNRSRRVLWVVTESEKVGPMSPQRSAAIWEKATPSIKRSPPFPTPMPINVNATTKSS